MLPAGFELKIPASERPQTHALDHSATGIGLGIYYSVKTHYIKLNPGKLTDDLQKSI
jgi:hypothetical protein